MRGEENRGGQNNECSQGRQTPKKKTGHVKHTLISAVDRLQALPNSSPSIDTGPGCLSTAPHKQCGQLNGRDV